MGPTLFLMLGNGKRFVVRNDIFLSFLYKLVVPLQTCNQKQ